MSFNLRNVVLSAVAMSLVGIAPSLAASIADVYTDDSNTITAQDFDAINGLLIVEESYGEIPTIPFPSHDGYAVVAIRNGNVQWFDKVLTLDAADVDAGNPILVIFQITNNTPYHWSDYHFEFYDSIDFNQRVGLDSVADWNQLPIGFDTGDAVLNGLVVATSTTGTVPDDRSPIVADGYNFYSTPGVNPGVLWESALTFDTAALVNAGICTVGQACDLYIRQIATTSVPEPSSMLGLLALSVVGLGATFKSKRNS